MLKGTNKKDIDFSKIPKHFQYFGEELICYTIETLMLWEDYTINQAMEYLEKREKDQVQTWMLHFDKDLLYKYKEAYDEWIIKEELASDIDEAWNSKNKQSN